MAHGKAAGWRSNGCPSVIPSIGRSPLSMTRFPELIFLKRSLVELGTTAVFGGQIK
jgi:hypothetical protein